MSDAIHDSDVYALLGFHPGSDTGVVGIYPNEELATAAKDAYESGLRSHPNNYTNYRLEPWTLETADLYQFYADRFGQKFDHDREVEDLKNQFLVAVSEFGELADELVQYDPESDDAEVTFADMEEELADCLVTLFVFADFAGIDARTAYTEEMTYNLSKSASMDGGKLTDDGEE